MRKNIETEAIVIIIIITYIFFKYLISYRFLEW